MTHRFSVTGAQQAALVLLRTLIGWHFLYEGYVKLLRPAWGRDGVPLDAWTSAGYLTGATGPFASLFHALGSASWIGALDGVIAGALVLIGLSLILGLFTQPGLVGAAMLLSLFYLSAIPLTGAAEPRTEGAYLLVNKNLIELVAVVVLLLFRTGEMAGLDRWRGTARVGARRVEEVAA